MRILGTDNCGEMRRKYSKCYELFQYFLFHNDYADKVVASFAHQIKSEYYGGNRSVSIKGI